MKTMSISDPSTHSTNAQPSNTDTDFGIRGTSAAPDVTQPFIVVQDTHDSYAANSKHNTMSPDLIGCDSVVHLGDRVSEVPTPAVGANVRVWDLIKQTYVYENVISKYAFWCADISVHVVPVFSPFTRGVYRAAYSYVTYWNPPSNALWDLFAMPGGTFVDVNVANGDGAIIHCPNITPKTLFSNTNNPINTFPGWFSLRPITTENTMMGHIKMYIHFDNLRVSYPTPVTVVRDEPFELAYEQMYDSQNNPIDKALTKITPNYSSTDMPSKTDDDLLLDNITEAFPFYVPPVDIAAAGDTVKKNLSDLLTQPLNLNSNRIASFHPITALLSCFRGIRCDYEVTLHCIKNHFQAGVLYVRYGGREVSNDISPKSISEYPTIAWNISEQDTLTFTIPYSFPYKTIGQFEESRFYRIFALEPIIPNPSGAGADVSIYAMIKLKNVAVMYPRTSLLSTYTPTRATREFEIAQEQNETISGTLNPSVSPSFLSTSLRPFLSLFKDGTFREQISDLVDPANVGGLDLFDMMSRLFLLRSGDITFAAGTAATWIERFSMFELLGTTIPATIAQVDAPIGQPGWQIIRSGPPTGPPATDENNLFTPLNIPTNIVHSLRKANYSYPVSPLFVGPYP